jgi:hypothetical protein
MKLVARVFIQFTCILGILSFEESPEELECTNAQNIVAIRGISSGGFKNRSGIPVD